MSTDTTCNGWRNVETWRVQLHLTHDEHEVARVRAMLATYHEHNRDHELGLRPQPERLAVWLRDYVQAATGCDTPGATTWEMFSRDVVQAALDRVDWEQLSGYWGVEDLRQEALKGGEWVTEDLARSLGIWEQRRNR